MENPNVKFTWKSVFRFSIQIVGALARLHNWKPPIVHRDIKSKNLLVDHRNNVKIADLGLARFTTFDNRDTLFKARGSLAYMAPEVWHSSSSGQGLGFTPASDVYSFSIVLWEMVYRCVNGKWRVPYPNKHPFEIITKVAKENLRPEVNEWMPPLLVELLTKCWEPEFSKRPTCEELGKLLETIHQSYKVNKSEWNRIYINSRILSPTVSKKIM